MNLDVAGWKRFALGRLFDIKKGKRLTSEDQEDGDNIYIGAIDSNNGVANHIGQEPIHRGNTISLSYNGSVGEAFYQPESYWATDDVNALYSKYDGFNEAIGLFMVAVIRQEKYKFSYGRKWTLENMNATEICLPVLHDADGSLFIDDACEYSDEGYVPDWQFMEDYIRSLRYKPLTTRNRKGRSPCLNVSGWKEFRIGDLFRLQRGHALTVEQKEGFAGIIPCVNGTIENNGVQCCLSKDIELIGFNLVKSPAISIVRVGNGGKTFVQTEDFYVADNAFALLPLQNMSVESMMFISSLLDREQIKYSYGRTVTNEYENTVIKLPIDPECAPDWRFMENYIKSLPYGDRL